MTPGRPPRPIRRRTATRRATDALKPVLTEAPGVPRRGFFFGAMRAPARGLARAIAVRSPVLARSGIRGATYFSQRRKARCLFRGAAPSMVFRIGLPIASARSRRRCSDTPGFFGPIFAALPSPFHIWSFALAGARSFCGALAPLAVPGLWPLFLPISGASPLVVLVRSTPLRAQSFFVLPDGAFGLLAAVVRVCAPVTAYGSHLAGLAPAAMGHRQFLSCASCLAFRAPGLPALLLARPSARGRWARPRSTLRVVSRRDFVGLT